MEKYTVYMDESGNTGSNFLDFSQPIFVLIGVGINHENMIPILLALDQLKAEFGFATDHVFHAKNLSRKTKEALTRKVIELLMQYHFDFFFAVVEKKFTIASYVDSEFLDPAYNDKCDYTWTYPSEEHRERADFFYNNLSDEAFIACGKAFQTGEGMQEAYEHVMKNIKGKEWKIDLYDILLGAKPHLDEIAQIISSTNNTNEALHVSSGVLQSPNYFSFSGLMNKIEYYYSIRDAYEVQIVFDSSRQFNTSFFQHFKLFRDANRKILPFKGRVPRIFGYNHLKDFTAESSKNSAFLQLSDLIATAIKNIVQKIYWDNGTDFYSEFECFMLFLILGHWEKFDDQFCDFVASQQLLIKMVNTLHDSERMAVLMNHSNQREKF